MAYAKDVGLLFSLDQSSEVPLYQQIYQQVRDNIANGVLTEGDRLPSIRRLSKEQGISHITVEQAYLQLTVEGFVRSVPRSGYIVNHLDAQFLNLPRADHARAIEEIAQERNKDAFFAENDHGGSAHFDFSYANLQPDSFPTKIWRQLVNDVLYANFQPECARYQYTDETGTLSRELAVYLQQARAVNCVPEQIVPQAGTPEALITLLQLFDPRCDIIGMEEPGYATVQEVAARMGFSLVPLPVGRGHKAFLDAVERTSPKIVFTTPSHQFPTGHVLTMDARTRLLKWANAANSYIIEDDSCNEYRYETKPIPSLQSLDAFSRVIYLGNFSKALSPSMRIAYLVLPPDLLRKYLELFNYAHPSVPWLEQETLARFIGEGHWERHIRRMATDNHKRHDVLLACLHQEMGKGITLTGDEAGMHLFAQIHNGMTQDELIQTARNHDVNVYGTKRFWFSQPAPENCVIIGYSSISIEDIPAGVAAIKKAWFS